MKIKHIVIIILIGFCLEFVCFTFFTMNWPFGAEMKIVRIIAMILKLIGIISLSYKLLTNSKFKEFLNW